jgi:hypothetical protein
MLSETQCKRASVAHIERGLVAAIVQYGLLARFMAFAIRIEVSDRATIFILEDIRNRELERSLYIQRAGNRYTSTENGRCKDSDHGGARQRW